MTRAQLIDLAGRTVSDPRGAADDIMGMRLSTEALALSVALVAVLSTILQMITGFLTGVTGGIPMGFAIVGPITAVLLAIGQVFVVALISWLAGRFIGGRGSFTDALALMCWLQFLITGVAVLQLIAFIVMPLLTVLLSLAIGVFSLWLMTNLTAALHGIDGMFRVFGMILLASFAVAICAVFIMSVLGIDLPNPAGAV